MPSNRSKSSGNGPPTLTRALGHERIVASVHYLFDQANAKRTRKQRSLSAFEALVAIGGYWRFASPKVKANPDWEPTAEELVTVPWWIVDFLAQAWIAHLDAPSGTTFGETLGIEGGGQGKRPAKEGWKNFRRDLMLALKVHEIRSQSERIGDKISYEEVFAQVAHSSKTSDDIVRRAWNRHGRKLTAEDKLGA